MAKIGYIHERSLYMNGREVIVLEPEDYIGEKDNKTTFEPQKSSASAGIVYYFELLNGAMADVKEVFHQTRISDMYQEQGFGISYVGEVEEYE